MAEFSRTWLPSEWLDESIPAPQETPDAFIHPLGDGRYQLRAPSEPADDDSFLIDIIPGQVVEFSACDDYGLIKIIVHEDQTFTATSPIPEGENRFWIPGQSEYSTDEIGGIVNDEYEPLEPGNHTLGAYRWEHTASFRFEVPHDGAPRLVLCAGLN